MGSGKTHLLVDFIKRSGVKNILWLSARRSYTASVLSRINANNLGFQVYDDHEHSAKTIQGDRILCQIDSLGRVNPEGWNILVLDEIMSLIQ